jgi:hypothetical protein
MFFFVFFYSLWVYSRGYAAILGGWEYGIFQHLVKDISVNGVVPTLYKQAKVFNELANAPCVTLT